MVGLRERIAFWLVLMVLGMVHAQAHAGDAHGIDCLKLRQDPSSAMAAPFLTLPFYQPSVDGDTIDGVVTDMLFPVSNRYTLHDSWRTPSGLPVIPIVHWRMSEYTGLAMDDLAEGQRGHVDAYAKSGEQMAGRKAGFWLNTQNDDTVLANGSLSTNLGCWYQGPPYARLFSNISQVLDVSFDAGVQYAAAIGGSHSQAYFQLIVIDTHGGCVGSCAFSISVGYNGPNMDGAARELAIHDDTGTTNLPLVGAGLDAPRWITRMPDSMHFRAGRFPSDHVHFRLSPSQLIMMRDAVADTFEAYQSLSKDPMDYAISLINVNGEVYDPCKAGAPSCGGESPGQLGMTVGDIRVTTVVPHEGAGAPSAAGNGSDLTVFRNGVGNVFGFSPALGPLGPSLGQVGNQRTTDDPSTTTGQGAQRVYFVDVDHHLNEAFSIGGSWSVWDMTAALGLPDAFSAPRAYTATDGTVRVYFRDILGDVHETRLGESGWSTSDLTVMADGENLPAALGSPVGYQAGSADRVVYRGVGNQIVELFFWGGRWQGWNMTTTPGAVPAAADPRPFVDQNGVARVIYRDINGSMHELRTESDGWHDIGIGNTTAALGSPSGLVVAGQPELIYEGVDHHLHLLTCSNDQWIHEDMSVVDGALPIVSDPVGYVGSDGIFRIDYLGGDSQLHEFFRQGGWLHRDF